MAHVFSPSGSSAFAPGARFSRRRGGGIDWRVVALTALTAAPLLLLLGQPT